jgi:hypothetical protein
MQANHVAPSALLFALAFAGLTALGCANADAEDAATSEGELSTPDTCSNTAFGAYLPPNFVSQIAAALPSAFVSGTGVQTKIVVPHVFRIAPDDATGQNLVFQGDPNFFFEPAQTPGSLRLWVELDGKVLYEKMTVPEKEETDTFVPTFRKSSEGGALSCSRMELSSITGAQTRYDCGLRLELKSDQAPFISGRPADVCL